MSAPRECARFENVILSSHNDAITVTERQLPAPACWNWVIHTEYYGVHVLRFKPEGRQRMPIERTHPRGFVNLDPRAIAALYQPPTGNHNISIEQMCVFCVCSGCCSIAYISISIRLRALGRGIRPTSGAITATHHQQHLFKPFLNARQTL